VAAGAGAGVFSTGGVGAAAGAAVGSSVVGASVGPGEGAPVAATGGGVGSGVASHAAEVQSPKITKKKVLESLRSCRQVKLLVLEASWTVYSGGSSRL
jgi:outer membrane lipoprotein SlyB